MSKPLSTSEGILDSASHLIARGGYHGFSYADIAAVVGIRKASIHHYFPNKSDLVVAVVRRYTGALQNGLASLEEAFPEPSAQIKAYTNHWRTCIADASHPYCVCVMLAGELPSLPEEVADAVRDYFKTLSGWLETKLAAGARTKKISLQSSPRSEAELFLATVHGAMLSARAYGEASAFGVVVDQLLMRLNI